MRFEFLSEANQRRARAMFFNAAPGDGYLYELDLNGNVLYRHRKDY